MELEIITHSRGLLSTWTAFPNLGLMFDVGEGAATGLFNRVGSIQHLAITHEHFDHVSGLTPFANLKFRLNPTQTLTVYLPSAHSRYDALINMLGNKGAQLHVVYVEAGKQYPIGANRFITPFKTDHSKHSHGYLVQHTKTKLRKDLAHLPNKEIAKLSREGVKVDEVFTETLIAYVGDSKPISDVSNIKNAEYLFLEATYLNKDDVDNETNHSTLEDAIATWKASGAKKLFLQHFSPRYKDSKVIESVKEYKENFNFILGRKIHQN